MNFITSFIFFRLILLSIDWLRGQTVQGMDKGYDFLPNAGSLVQARETISSGTEWPITSSILGRLK